MFVGFAEKAVGHFNFIAKEIGCPALDSDEIRISLRAEIDQQAARTFLVARSAMLSLFGEDSDLRANYDRLIRLIAQSEDASPILPQISRLLSLSSGGVAATRTKKMESETSTRYDPATIPARGIQ